jgi:hypothetical protein
LLCGTSLRGGTFQGIHISELGAISRKWFDKAHEIITGSLEVVAPGQLRFVESTADGNTGFFADMCQRSQEHGEKGLPLTVLDYKFHFFPFFKDPTCTFECGDSLDISPDKRSYFEKLERKNKMTLTNGQKLFYIKKEQALGDDIFREYPGSPEECFSSSMQGTYFRTQFEYLRKNKQICEIPVHPGILVDCFWDLGVADCTAIFFVQNSGKAIHVIDYLEDNNEGLPYYAKMLKEEQYAYGRLVAPHDMAVREFTTGKDRVTLARNYGLNFEVAPLTPIADQIAAARDILPICWFDEKRCALGLDRLESYRKKWYDKRGTWAAQPFHGPESHGASAFLTMAISHQFGSDGRYTVRTRKVMVNSEYIW